ncbi:MAG: SDR family NAD(P)-dependent oxidoreductase [Candidatus Puniceispirillales bacterium]
MTNRVALVTGASRGLGRAAALALAATGVEIIATARTVGGLEELDDEISALGGKATLVPMDLSDRPAMTKLANAIHERWGRLDVMIANAGILGVLMPASHLDESIWDEVIDTNLSAIWRMIRVFDPLLRLSPAGRAVLVTSSAAQGYPFWSAYAASKAGVEALGKCWAGEVATTAMKVNILNPGGVATSMYASAFPGADLPSMPQPEDIAPAFVALADENCPHHGEVIHAQALIGG